jgi:small-conductance mechanosensitive channel
VGSRLGPRERARGRRAEGRRDTARRRRRRQDRNLTTLEQRLRAAAATIAPEAWFPWLVAAAIVVGGTVALSALRALIYSRLSKRAARTPGKLDDLLAELTGRTSHLFLMALAILAAVTWVELPPRVERVGRGLATLVCLVQVGLWTSRIIRELVDRRMESATSQGGVREHQAVVRLLTLGMRLVLWAILVLVALDNLGINITALVTGLGVGGVAVALATQNILGDIFASVSILLDKPFVLGDFVAVDDYMGWVEQIGIKTTRLRSVSGELIVFSNSDLLKSRLRNYKTQRERRVLFRFTIVTETPTDKVQALGGALRAIVERQAQGEGSGKIRFDRAHFAAYTDQGLLFEVVYFVLDADYGLYMDVQQSINLEIHRALAKDGVALATPMRAAIVPPAK